MNKARIPSKNTSIPENEDRKLKSIISKIVFFIAATISLLPFMSPPLALCMGLVFAQFLNHPNPDLNQKAVHWLLQLCIVGLGFGMNLTTALSAGKQGFLFTVGSIAITLTIGYFLGKFLKINSKTSFLISVGTAICGGSAIAAVSPIIKPKANQISVALGVVFILNSIALFIFPVIGHYFHLSQNQFGLWCAISIHDTSSVVGAASRYGNLALEIATTVKLARALWIVPITIIAMKLFKSKGKIKPPYFIGLFIIALVLNTYVPSINAMSSGIVSLSKAGLCLTLFLIGCGLPFKVIASIGIKPLLQGIILWMLVSVFSLWIIIGLCR